MKINVVNLLKLNKVNELQGKSDNVIHSFVDMIDKLGYINEEIAVETEKINNLIIRLSEDNKNLDSSYLKNKKIINKIKEIIE